MERNKPIDGTLAWGKSRVELNNILNSLTDNVRGFQFAESRAQISYLAGADTLSEYVDMRAHMHLKLDEICAQLSAALDAECNAFVAYLGFQRCLEIDFDVEEFDGWEKDLEDFKEIQSLV